MEKICSHLKHEKYIQESGNNKVDVITYIVTLFFC